MKKRLLIIAAFVSASLLMASGVIGYQDWQLRGSAPGNPASGFLRIWADTTAGYFKCLTSAGTVCHFEGTASSTIKGIVQPDGNAAHYVDGTGAWSVPAGAGITYPGAGVANSTGSAWSTSYTVGTGNNNLVQLNGSAKLPAVDGSLLTNLQAGYVPYPPLTAPPASSWSAVNIGSSTFTTLASGALTLASPLDATNQLKMEVRSTPAAPWTLTAAIMPGVLPAAQYPFAGICLRESGTGKVYTFGLYENALASGTFLGLLSWTSPTSGGSDLGTQALYSSGLLWLQFSLDTGTGCSGGPCITWNYSMDGNYWIEVLKVSKTALFTTGPDQAGLVIDPRNGTYGAGLTLYSWNGIP